MCQPVKKQSLLLIATTLTLSLLIKNKSITAESPFIRGDLITNVFKARTTTSSARHTLLAQKYYRHSRHKRSSRVQTPAENPPETRDAITNGFVFQFVQKTQAMPSRELPGSQTDELGESTLYVEDVPPIVTNVSKYRIKRDQTNGRNERRGQGTTTTQRTISDDGSIRFPEEVVGQVYPAPEPSPACIGKTFCEETASGYPQDYLSNIISRSDGLKQFANVDQIDIGERLDSSDADTLCGSQSQVVFPKLGENGKKEWVFILQDEKQGYRQGVKVENCNEGTADGRCQVIDDFVTGYTTSCKQKYVFRVLAVANGNGTAHPDPIKMPSSCCCQIKYVGGNVGSRIAAAVTPLKNQTPAVTAKSARKP